MIISLNLCSNAHETPPPITKISGSKIFNIEDKPCEIFSITSLTISSEKGFPSLALSIIFSGEKLLKPTKFLSERFLYFFSANFFIAGPEALPSKQPLHPTLHLIPSDLTKIWPISPA